MNKKLTPAEMARAKRKLARDRGIGPETVTDESVMLALESGSVLLSSLAETPSSPSACDLSASQGGINSYDTPLSSSSGSDGGSFGGGCD